MAPDSDGPGDWYWFCLVHVREFNTGYDWFAGMSADEILRAQSPIAGWAHETRAFRPNSGVDKAPRWADFFDPLEALNARSRRRRPHQQENAANYRFSAEERRAIELMELDADADRVTLRRRYSELVRRYHPDRNGGDRSFEERLGRVVEAYQLLRKSDGFP